MKKSLSLIVPCYNEQEVLPLFYEETGKVLQKLSAGFQTELVFVNDGSADNTLDVLKQFAEKDPSVKYISFSRNFGKESAMLAGMEYAVHADYVGIIDADLQHSPDLITEMLYYVDQEGYDVAAAKREDRAGEAKLKSALSEGFYKVINRVSDTKISDSAQDFRIMKRKIYDSYIFTWLILPTYIMLFFLKPVLFSRINFLFFNSLNAFVTVLSERLSFSWASFLENII